MTDNFDRAAFETAVRERSPLTAEHVARLFGGEVTAENKAVVWRFLNMGRNQQASIWQVFLRIKHVAPDFTVEAVH